jgi:hypothetical protein
MLRTSWLEVKVRATLSTASVPESQVLTMD